jgi:hypothetical protein
MYFLSYEPLFSFLNREVKANLYERALAISIGTDASDFINGQIIYVDGGILATIGKPADE